MSDEEELLRRREHQSEEMQSMSVHELINIIFEGEDEIDRLSQRAGVLLAKLRYIESFCEAIK